MLHNSPILHHSPLRSGADPEYLKIRNIMIHEVVRIPSQYDHSRSPRPAAKHRLTPFRTRVHGDFSMILVLEVITSPGSVIRDQ